MRLPPDAFWALSLAEWRLLCGSDAAMDRARLDQLFHLYPDRKS